MVSRGAASRSNDEQHVRKRSSLLHAEATELIVLHSLPKRIRMDKKCAVVMHDMIDNAHLLILMPTETTINFFLRKSRNGNRAA